MRTFVKYDKKGTILATCRMESIPEGLDHPFLELKAGESVLEVEPKIGPKEISCVEIHEKYKVDGRRKKLVLLR
jgi:hypothetical protein